ncbi:Glycosyl transferase family 8 [Lasiodiplodia theobromae]|uniref:Glycosyl transferase family 8 n=1 Tax=Lasiodiplodia theobromae TaxID=45133 RepID=UPI0015C3533F|nr:Glycosyl transferase family 8 [Lasiodiplodia theobromae]KAF4539138.1 Glycosyl transferase family 8 [Lasiodiplodia theobromae]
MPNGTYNYPKIRSPRTIHVPPSSYQQQHQWSSRGSGPRSWRRSRCLTLVAVALLLLLWYNHGSRSKTDPNAAQRLPNGLLPDAGVDWSRFAYSQYATNGAYLCNSVMLFSQLAALGSRADRVLFYPEEWDLTVESTRDRDSQLLVMARDTLGVKLIPMNMQSVRASRPTSSTTDNQADEEEETWDFSINKFLAWNLTQYDRVLHLDSDVTLRNNHLDDLFFLPPAPAAMPRAYWELPHTRKLTSLLVLLTPSQTEFEALMHAAFTSEGALHRFDMELLNERYADSALVLPHRRLAMLTGEFRRDDHTMYLGAEDEFWDTEKVLKETRLIHFSDWPLPKPWIMWPNKLLAEMLPKCRIRPGTAAESGCQDREVWKALYEDFRERRKDVCKLLSVPAPQWPPPPKMSKPKAKSDDDGAKTKDAPDTRATP